MTFVEGDLTTFATEAPFDLAAALGATFDGYRSTLARLAGHVHPGGLVLLGELYWRRDPSEAYLAALEATRDELPDYGGLFEPPPRTASSRATPSPRARTTSTAMSGAGA